jgi:lysophospholipase L1-like esterase
MRALKRFGLGLLAVTAIAALPLEPAVAAPGDHPYIALGDSISVGYPYGASAPDKSFVSRLYSHYAASLGADQVLNRAQPGASTTSLRDGGQLATALADINAPSDTVAVTLDTGGYEAIFGSSCPGHWDEPSVCPVRANFAYIASQLQMALDADPGTEPFTVFAYYNPYSGAGGSQETADDRALLGDNVKVGCEDTGADVGLNDVIFQEAGKLGLPVANGYPPIKAAGQADIDPDHIHPNDAGHAAIAEAFRNADSLCSSSNPGDTDAPETTITKGLPETTHKHHASFKFRSDETGSDFQCKLDKQPFKRCTSPEKVRLEVGRHKFAVRAIDAAGNVDPTPATDKFKVRG